MYIYSTHIHLCTVLVPLFIYVVALIYVVADDSESSFESFQVEECPIAFIHAQPGCQSSKYLLRIHFTQGPEI